MRLGIHPGKGALVILRRHVVSPRQTAIGQRLPIVEIVPRTCLTRSHDLQQFVMSNRAEVAAHLWQRQSGQRFLGFDSVITHRFFLS